jgi:hypothetical protein
MRNFSSFHSSPRSVKTCVSRVRAVGLILGIAALVGAGSSPAAAATRCTTGARSQGHAAKQCSKVSRRKCRTRRGKRPVCRQHVVKHRRPTKAKKPPKRTPGSKPLPAPPKPVAFPSEPPGYHAPTGLVSPTTPTTTTTTPPQARTWGASGPATTLIVYDSTNTWGYLGVQYANAAGDMATRFGKVTAEPVIEYITGQVNSYTATIYIGSTYDEPIPTAFLNDVLSTTHPVIWAGWNVWQLSGTPGSSANTAFRSHYGWDPSTSYIDTLDDPLTVSSNGQSFTRGGLNGANIVAPHITNPAAVTVLARANCTSSTGKAANCASIAQSTGTSFPWAVKSANLTFVGEEPFSYTSATDRVLVFSALLSATLG